MAELQTQPDTKSLPTSIGGSLNSPIDQYVQAVTAGKKAEAGIEQKLADYDVQKVEPLIQQERQFRAETLQKQKPITEALQKPFQIPQETMTDIASLGGMLAIVGPLLGAAGKQPAGQAIAAMTGIMDGYQKGRKDLIDQSYKQFDANMKRLQALQKAIDTEMNAYVEDLKLGRASAELHKASLAALLKNGSAETIAKSQSAGEILKFNENRMQLNAQMTIAANRLAAEEKRWSAEQQAKDRVPVYTDEKGSYNAKGQLIPGSENKQKFGAKGSKEAGTVGYAAELQRLMPDQDNKLNEKDSKPISEAIHSTARLVKFIDKAQDPDIDFGELGRISNRIESLITRNIGPKTEITNANQLRGATDKAIDQLAKADGLSPNDKNIVFYKEAIFEILDSERAIRGGSILPVGIVNMLTPLQDPKNMNKKQFTQIMLGNLERVAAKTTLQPEVLKTAISNVKPFTYTPIYTPPASTNSAGSSSTNTPPAAYPNARLGKDPQGNLGWYIQKDGKSYKVQ